MQARDSAREAGRGGVAVLGAKIFFIVTGFVQQPLLRLAVGLRDFGALAQALVIANTVNNVVVASGTQGVSRIVAASPGRERAALRATMGVHVPAAFLVALLLAGVSPAYARFERADDVIAPLLILAGVALLYGLYAPLIGYLNGCRQFGRQAALDVAFATLRTVGMVVAGHEFAVHARSGVLGITLGWVIATALVVPLAWNAVRRTAAPGPAAAADATSSRRVPAPKTYLRILLPIAGTQICTNLLLQVDLLLLGRFLSDGARASAASDARDIVKVWLGIYRECQTFAFLPYQLLFSVSLVLFPMLARAYGEKDPAAVRRYVAHGARLAAIFGGLLVGVVVAAPQAMLAFAYGPADALQGAGILRTLALAQAAFAMLSIATTILTSTGRESTAAVLTFGAVCAVSVACVLLVPHAAPGRAQLLRTAEAVAVALWSTLAVAAAVVRAHTGAFVPVGTATRVGLAMAACVAMGLAMPHAGRLAAPAEAFASAVVYAAVLALTGELRRSDWTMLAALRGRAR